MNAPQDLLAKHGIRLESYRLGRYYTTCPRCSQGRTKPGHKNSKCLGVTIEADGSVRWGCNHCQWTGPEKGDGWPQLQTYDYPDADGTLLFQKVRNPPGSAARFYCRQPDGNGRWINNLKGIDHKPLYRWPEIRKAMEQGREIALVEGEKDADALWALDIPATCNFDGAPDVSKNPKARKWKAEYSEQLRGARLIVFNDNDSQGYAHADHICRDSHNIAARIRRLDLALHWPDMPKGADVSDWLALGHTREELDALIAQAPEASTADDTVGNDKSDEADAGTADDKQEDASNGDADAEIERLAKLSAVEYEQQRTSAAEKLGFRTSILDKLVEGERRRLNPDADDGKQGHAIAFPEPEPWPEKVDGAALLDGVAEAIRNHVVMSDHCRDASALWVVHSFLVERFIVSPRLGVRSPVKQCGKTTLLDVLGRLVLRPLPTASVTPAAIFRVVEAHRPTLLIDEADTFLRGERADELRGVLNGNRKGAVVLRTVGDDHEPRAFSVYSACAIALIGTLPDTLHDRAVTIDLQRRRPNETITPYRPDRADHLDVLARKAARWAQDHAERVAEADPVMPAGIINRAADNWRPLLAIADAAGVEWGKRARKAAEASRSAEGEDASRLELLLGDIRDIHDEKNISQISSGDLVQALVDKDGRPWAEMGRSEKPLTQKKLAVMLKRVRIAAEQIRVLHQGGITGQVIEKQVRGYIFTHFEEAFERYLPQKGDSKCQSVTNPTNTGTSEISKVSQPEDLVTLRKCEKSNNDGLCDAVTHRKGGSGEKTRTKSGDLPHTGPVVGSPLDYHGPVVAVPDMGPDTLDEHGVPRARAAAPSPLTSGRARELHAWSLDWTASEQAAGREVTTAVLEAELRVILREELPPDEVEAAIAQVMDLVFKV
jgi:putative DNA primase/helicase